MTPGPGWYRDPYFLNHERYWNDGWTDNVRRIHVEQPALSARPVTPALARDAGPGVGDTALPREAVAEAVAVVVAAAAGMAAPYMDSEQHTATRPIAGSPGSDAEGPGRGELPTGESPAVHDDDTLIVAALPRNDDTLTVPAVSADPDTLSLPVTSSNNGESPPDDRGPSSVAHPNAAAPQSPAPLAPQSPAPLAPQSLDWERGGASADEAAAVRSRSRRRRLGFVAGAVVLVILGAVAVVVATGGSPDKSGTGGGNAGTGAASAGSGSSVASAASPTDAQNLTTIATKALHENSVLVSFALTPVPQSATQRISGSGAFLLDSGLGVLSVTVPGATAQDQKFVFQGQTLYVNVTDSPAPGTSWVVASTNDLPALGPNSSLSSLIEQMGNPGQLLQQLTGTASLSVTSLGTSTINGVSVHGYRVSFSSSPETLSDAGFSSATSEEVDIGAGGHVRQIVIPLASSGTGGQENVVVSFSHYGKAISVATPPASQLIPLSQYLIKPPTPTA